MIRLDGWSVSSLNRAIYLLWWSDKQHFPYNSLGLSGEDNSVSRTDNFVIVNVFNSVTSSRVTRNRHFARKEELIYETVAVLTSNTTCPLSAILGDFLQVTFIALKYHSFDAPWSLGRKSVFCTFLRVLYRVHDARSAFYTWVRILYPARNALVRVLYLSACFVLFSTFPAM